MDEPPVDLAGLVRWVERRTRRCTELDRLALAVKVTAHLEAVREELLDHYVEAARAGGASWSSIGDCLGVTKQAAHQRHLGGRRGFRRGERIRRRSGGSGGPFGRLSGQARDVIVAAQGEARGLRHGYVGTEHLLIALAAGPQAGRLADAGLGPDVLRAAVEREVGPGPQAPAGRLRFAPAAKRALAVAVLRAGEEPASPADLLFAVLSVPDAMASRIARSSGADVAALIQALS